MNNFYSDVAYRFFAAAVGNRNNFFGGP